MSSIPVLVVTNAPELCKNPCDLLELNNIRYKLVDTASKDFVNFIKTINDYFIECDAQNIVIIENISVINIKTIDFIKRLENNISFVDYFQFAGGSITFLNILNWRRNFKTAVAIKLLQILPNFLIQLLSRKITKIKKKNLGVTSRIENAIILKQFLHDLIEKEPHNPFTKNILNWNLIRFPLDGYVISQNWAEGMGLLSKQSILAIRNIHRSLARSGNYKSTSKTILFKSKGRHFENN